MKSWASLSGSDPASKGNSDVQLFLQMPTQQWSSSRGTSGREERCTCTLSKIRPRPSSRFIASIKTREISSLPFCYFCPALSLSFEVPLSFFSLLSATPSGLDFSPRQSHFEWNRLKALYLAHSFSTIRYDIDRLAKLASGCVIRQLLICAKLHKLNNCELNIGLRFWVIFFQTLKQTSLFSISLPNPHL